MTFKIPNQIGDYSLFALASFIFAFIFWPIALVLGIMALSDIKKQPKLQGKALAWIGIILPLIFAIFMLLFVMGLGFGAGSGFGFGNGMFGMMANGFGECGNFVKSW